MSVMLSKADIERMNDGCQALMARSIEGEFINISIDVPNPVRAYLLRNGDIFTINDTIIEHEYKGKGSVFYELKETTFFCPITRMYFTNQYRTGKEFTKEELECLAYEKICNNLRDAIDKNATVKANSIEEALQNFNNEYNIVDDCEDDSYIRNIYEDDIEELEE